ncbi:ribokinase [Microbacterium koreense]|uniref:Ribokinase n=1 Tax=Microbacterium koreense TaxID=323761 RepID=A0ABW2ZNA4_9MICO
MPRVAVLGSANMDLVVRQPHAVRPGETIFGTSFSTGAGGKGLNQAIAAARAGADVTFIGAVGRDEFGARLRQRLVDDGVDVAALRSVEEATGIAAITVTDDGENSIVVVPGANGYAGFTEADAAAVAASAYLVVQLERPEALLRAAMRFARDRGVTTVLTPAPAREGIDDLVALADVLVPNEHEAAQLSGESDTDEAARVLSRTGGTVVVTRGARGAIVARAGEIVHRVAAHSATAVDTTGAGDTFTGVLVAWLAGGATWPDALDAAAAGAALAVGRAGASDAAPTKAEVVAALG